MTLPSFGATSARPLTQFAATDQDHDGYPDATELVGQDRKAFTEWFAAIAEAQFYSKAKDWKNSEQDCAGLLRYAYRNALARHDARWFKKFGIWQSPRFADVAAYRLPVPLLGQEIFRVAPGQYQVGDVEAGRFLAWADAKHLANFSSTRISRDVKKAERGDMLFFLRPGLSSYHSMVYLGDGLVVYHTGAGALTPGAGALTPSAGAATPATNANGQVRLLSIATLLKHPDSAFHPLLQNPNFLGVYRWKIIQ